ncbi:MAG: hypothetical protein J1E85_03410 [Ruminococcus sp.]|nr:hypothetical protein [Ruminococcus sp.]
MKEPKYHIYMTDKERLAIIKSLISLKNYLISQGKYTDVVDELILKILKAQQKNLKIIYK